MIGIVDVEVQSHNPSMPLYPLRAFVNSPSSVRVRNVPKKIGNWLINKVYFNAAYPDGSIKSADCVLVGGVWVGTIEGSSTSGSSINGYTIFADGKDENGNDVTGYILGKGDIQILEADGTITPGETTYYVHMLSGAPEQPKEGDLWPLSSGGYVIYQNGQANPLGLTEDDLSAYALKSDLSDYAKEDDLSAYATKTIEETVTYTYELPTEWYDNNIGTTLFFTKIQGSKITWSESSTKLTYDVETHELAYTSYNGKSFSFGEYTPEDIQQHMQDYMPFEYYDEETDTYYSVQPYTPENYDFDITVTKDVMYAEGGASVLSTKQDALDAKQLSAVNSGITSEKVAAYDALLSSQVELAQDITYAELYWKAQGGLEPGKTYRITDYVTTTTQADTSAVSEVCPIIVRAVDKYGLSPYGYMPSYGCEIKYNLINDTNRFGWADSHGTGVIYWMRDRHGNECPYDFKHILFKPYDPRTNPTTKWYYTFFKAESLNGIKDASELGYVSNNIIMPTYAQSGTSYTPSSKLQVLNNIVIGAQYDDMCVGNYFGQNCKGITIGFLENNTYSGGTVQNNWFGQLCNRIFSKGYLTNNFFEGVNNNLALGYGVSHCHFEKAVSNIILGNSVDELKSYWYYNYFAGPILRLNLTTTQTTSTSNRIQANRFGKYLAYNSSQFVTLNIDTVGQQYEVEYKRNGSKTITFN